MMIRGKGKFKRTAKKKDKWNLGRTRKKVCKFCQDKMEALDYKDLRRVERLVSERGKILSRRLTGTCARHQRKVVEAVKRARLMALIPFVRH